VAAEEALARIAIARKDVEGAREHAAAAQRADPSAPIVTFVDGLIACNQGRYEEALPLFVSAAAAKRNRMFPLADLHFYTADALRHLERWDEAIAELDAELALFPRNLKARANLALTYVAAGRPEDGEHTLSDLIKVARTPEGYGIAAHAWTTMGESRRAQALKAEARRLFRGDPTLKSLARAN
jgi:tetratricopeptide (TPR) repeat protein